jgi:hypothetical protein
LNLSKSTRHWHWGAVGYLIFFFESDSIDAEHELNVFKKLIYVFEDYVVFTFRCKSIHAFRQVKIFCCRS